MIRSSKRRNENPVASLSDARERQRRLDGVPGTRRPQNVYRSGAENAAISNRDLSMSRTQNCSANFDSSKGMPEMSSAYTLLSAFAIILGTGFLMFLVRLAGDGLSRINRRRRISQPRVVCRLRVGK